MNEEEKLKAIELAQKMGLIVSFTNEKDVFVTDGHIRKKINWNDVFPELERYTE